MPAIFQPYRVSLSPPQIGTRWDLAWVDWQECCPPNVQKPPPGLAIDTETTGFEWTDMAFCASIAWEDLMGRISSHYLPFPESIPVLRAMMLQAAQQGSIWVFHNAGFDLKKLIALRVITRKEIEAAHFVDTQGLAIYLDNLQPLKLKGTGPNNLVHRYLHRDQTVEFERLRETKAKIGLKKDDGYDMLPASILVPYAIQDAKDTYDIWRTIKKIPGRWTRMIRREMEVTLALLDMEHNGMAVDVDYLHEQQGELADRLFLSEKNVREMANQITGITDWTPPSSRPKHGYAPEQLGLDGVEPPSRQPRRPKQFNPGSTEQLAQVLMALGYLLDKTDKGAWQVDKRAIERCRRHHKHPFLDAITEYRRLSKLYGTYIVGILAEQVDGVLHPHFRQYAARTGRFGSGKDEDA